LNNFFLFTIELFARIDILHTIWNLFNLDTTPDWKARHHSACSRRS